MSLEEEKTEETDESDRKSTGVLVLNKDSIKLIHFKLSSSLR